MKLIYIDGNEFLIDSKNYLNEGISGKCYHVSDNDREVVVKLYHPATIFDNDDSYFPSEDLLQKFIQLSPCTRPILLSQFIVRDCNGNYIGCARDYIQPSCDDSVEGIFSLPKEASLQFLQNIQSKIPIFNQHDILLDDWNFYNIMLGKIHEGGEGLYIFDDSNYSFSTNPERINSLEFLHLTENLIELYLLKHQLSNIRPFVIDHLRSSYTPIYFFEEISHSYPTLGEGILQYAKKKKNSYFL